MKCNELIYNINRPPPDDSSRITHYRFDRNERTTLFTDNEFKDMISNLHPYDFVAYGELEPFYNKIKDWLNLSRDQILLTSGSDMAIRSIFETFIHRNDKVLITQPNYAMFSVYNKMYGGVELAELYNEDLSLDIEHLLNNITDDLKMIVISNPGHTGKALSNENIIKIIKKANQKDTLIVVDEAYFHFYNFSVIKYIDDYDNLIVTRTFSKAIGLASLRIGFLVSNNNLIKELYKVKLVHEITGVAAKIGSYMIDNFHIVNNYVNYVNEGKIVLLTRLPEIGIKVYESDCNIFFFDMPKNTDHNHFMDFLKVKNIYIKGPFLTPPFKGQMRLTVGNTEQMNMFCDVVFEYFNKFNK